MGSLKSFIKAVRYSKTIADERSVIRKESAAIRTAFKDVNLSNNKRRVAIQKLLYLYILGEKTHFGQIECIKLLASQQFVDKRLGYLAASLLLDENQEIITLLTNSLVYDLNHSNPYFVALALQTLANVASYDLSNDTYNDVIRILKDHASSAHLKKKALIVSAKLIEKNHDLVEIFYENITGNNVLNVQERDHSILLGNLQLLRNFFIYGDATIKTSVYVEHLPKVMVLLKRLSSNPEYDILGIPDPFLYVSYLQTISLMIKLELNDLQENDNDQTNKQKFDLAKLYSNLNDQFSDLLAEIQSQVTIGKNAVNLILYEVVKAIFQLKTGSSALRGLGVNILGRFLVLKDNPNIRYISLNTLLSVVKSEPKTIQRHQKTIMSCLFDNDISIKRRALELVFEILNEQNIQQLMPELVYFLEATAKSSDSNEFSVFNYNLSKDLNDFSLNMYSNKAFDGSTSLNNLDLKFFVTSKLTVVLKNYSPNLKFFFDHLVILLKLNGNYLTNENISFILAIISNVGNGNAVKVGPSECPADSLLLQSALVDIFDLSLKNFSNNGLNLINVWCIGEFANFILNSALPSDSTKRIDGDLIIKYYSDLINKTTSQLINSYILTSLVKVSKFFGDDFKVLASLETLIDKFSDSINLNLQLKAVEYLEILQIKDQSTKYGLLERIPPPMIKDLGKVSLSNNSEESLAINQPTQNNAKSETENFLLDLMDDSGTSASQTTQPQTKQLNADLLSDIFGSTPAPATTPAPTTTASIVDLFNQPTQQPASSGLSDIFGSGPAIGSGTGAATSNFAAASETKNNSFLSATKYTEIYKNEDISVKLDLKNLKAGAAQIEIFLLNVNANQSTTVSDCHLLIAVAKTQRLTIVPQESVNVITKDNYYNQDLKITGKLGSKLKLRVKVMYKVDGHAKESMFDYNLNKTL